MKKLKTIELLAVTLSLIFFSLFTQAAEVKKVSGKKVLIEDQDGSLEMDEKYFVLDPETDAKIGIIEITSIKGKKVIAAITKGKAQVGSLVTRGERSKGKKGGTKGLYVGLINSKMFIKDGVGDNNLAGTGYALTGFFDYKPLKAVNLRFAGGYENLVAKGGFNSDGTEGTVNIGYISLGGVAQYVLTQKYPIYWLGAGGAYMFPASNGSSKIKTASSNYYMSIALGLDLKAGSNIIPISIETALFPSSKTTSSEITLSATIIRFGFSF